MIRRYALLACTVAALASLPATTPSALAQPSGAAGNLTLTVKVTNVHSSEGNILANLCDDPKASFPGACMTHRGMVKASEGETVLVFEGVKPGTYALQMFHDENQNFIPNIPPEGFAYGNDQPFPPDFAKASYNVTADTTVSVKMTYLNSTSAAPAGGSKGAAAPEGVERIDVREDGLYGSLYMPQSETPLPALLVLGGSEGGLQAASGVGVSFAARGYAVLSLAYFMEQGLPQSLENIPLEYFDKAIERLKKQPGIDTSLIGVIGGSRGSEAALLLAARNPAVKAVMAFAPSGVVWQGLNFENPMNMGPAWTVGGKALPFLTPDPMLYRPGGAMKPMFDAAMAKDKRTEANIPVEKIGGPILLISGGKDALWPSFDMGETIMARLKAAGFPHAYQHLSYPDAGHMVFMGDPAGSAAASMAKAPANPMLGGDGASGLAAWTDNWPRTLAFFDGALKGKQQ